MEDDALQALRKNLQQQEEKLQQAYASLGKRAQEFVRYQSERVDHLVDDIIHTKQKIAKLEREKYRKQRKG